MALCVAGAYVTGEAGWRRLGRGRYVIPWHALFAADEQRGRAVLRVDSPDQVAREGWVPLGSAWSSRPADAARRAG